MTIDHLDFPLCDHSHEFPAAATTELRVSKGSAVHALYLCDGCAANTTIEDLPEGVRIVLLPLFTDPGAAKKPGAGVQQ